MSLQLEQKPEELKVAFFSLRDRKDIARLLEVDLSKLTYYLYSVPESTHYRVFFIRKNLGGYREIAAPISSLKILQRKLNQVLQAVYKPKLAVHSYIKGEKRSIVTNAKLHVGKKLLLNLDLKDFFPSINFGRVRGLFLSPPYNLNEVVSTTLAKICCYNKCLPQGAPTSPIISNIICSKMDSQLSKLATDYNCVYTRYADDITFSSDEDFFPDPIVQIQDSKLEPGDKLKDIIQNNGFNINSEKLKLKTNRERQAVTGIITNKFPNVRREFIRNIRAMLHAWEKFGLDLAEADFLSKYDKKDRIDLTSTRPFNFVVKGKIEFLGAVRGKNDPIYLHYREKLRDLAPDLIKKPETPFEFLTRTSRSSPVYSVVAPVLSGDIRDVSRLLFEIDPGLEVKRVGAWQTFSGTGSDRLSQSSHSMRELVRLLLDILAPDDKVKDAPWYSKPPDGKASVTRRMRVRYCLGGSSNTVSHSKLDYIESVAKFVEESYASLCSEAHSDKPSDISNVQAYMQSCEITIWIILLNRST